MEATNEIQDEIIIVIIIELELISSITLIT